MPPKKKEKDKRRVDTRSPWAMRNDAATQPKDITLEDLGNPYNRYSLLMIPAAMFIRWLIGQHLLAPEVNCDKCSHPCNLQLRGRALDGMQWRCTKNTGHEISVRRYSFFQGSHFFCQDLFNFVITYLEGASLAYCARVCGLYYANTAVDWAQYMRDLFMQWVADTLLHVKFTGVVEIDESMFGRRVKYHKGNPNVGLKVWIVGLVERSSGRLLLLPVDDRSAETLEGIIGRHVVRGATIYTDGWAG